MATLGIKGTDPTGPQAQIGSSKGHMFNDNPQVNITMVFTICPLPGDRMITTGDNNNWCLFKPISGIGLRYFAFYFFISKDNEVPGL